ncbi:MAG: outer membrane beta-barrel protein [Ignavibacteriales bacterium]|nr:outer membrane beta-barrel protein [Ignavibacteriales bacterium]
MKKSFLLIWILLLILNVTGNAQFKMGVTPVTGINFNLHNGSDLEENGNGFGFMVGAQADLSFSQSVGLIAGLAFYDNRSGSYSYDFNQGGVQFNNDISASLAYFQIETLLKFSLPSRFYFVFGPELGFNIEAENETTQSILTPGYTYQNDETTYKTKTTLKNTQTRFGLKAGAGFEIPLADKIDIVPQLTFGYGLSNVIEDVEWKLMTFQAQVGLKFSIL